MKTAPVAPNGNSEGLESHTAFDVGDRVITSSTCRPKRYANKRGVVKMVDADIGESYLNDAWFSFGELTKI